MTTKLWGVGDTAPYWHDGSSPTLRDAIMRHGGEAQASREAFANATEREQEQLLAFLKQLRVGLVGEVMPVSKGRELLSSDAKHLPLNRTTAQE